MAPWQVDAVHPVRGHVCSADEPEEFEPPELIDPEEAVAPACWALLPVAAWQLVAEHPVTGHKYVCPDAAAAWVVGAPLAVSTADVISTPA